MIELFSVAMRFDLSFVVIQYSIMFNSTAREYWTERDNVNLFLRRRTTWEH